MVSDVHKFIICGLYIPPKLHIAERDIINNYILSSSDYFLNSFPIHSLILAGDFNRFNIKTIENQLCVTNLVTSFTRRSSNSVLDLILISNDIIDNYNEVNILAHLLSENSASDHSIVLVKSTSLIKSNYIECEVFDLRSSHISVYQYLCWYQLEQFS